MPGQGRLALKCARRPCRPDLDGPVIAAAASDKFAISTDADRRDAVFETSQHAQHGEMNSSKTEVINSPAEVPGQRRLTLEVARRPYRPDLHRLVLTATSDEFAISTEADRIDPVLETSQHVHHGGMNSSNTAVINSPVGVPGQRRLEFTRRRVPDFDGFVPAAAGNLFAV